MKMDKTIYIELLASLKTIQQKSLEADYVAEKIAVLESLLSEDKQGPENVKPIFKEYKGDVFIHTDGGSRGNPGPAGCGCVIKIGDYVIKANQHLGNGTNNEAEYSGVMLAVQKMIELGLSDVTAYFNSDSQLAMNQLAGTWRIKEPRLKVYADEIKELLNKHNIHAFFSFVPREQNKEADLLTNLAIDGEHIDEIINNKY